MKKSFTLEFEDGSAAATGRPNDGISLELSGDESLKVEIHQGIPMVWASRAALVALGKTLLKMGLSEYKPGFHLQFREDFGDDAARPDVLTIGIAK